MENKQECQHEWAFKYSGYYEGQRLGYPVDVYYCRKCLEERQERASEWISRKKS